MMQWSLRVAAMLIWIGISAAFLAEPYHPNDNENLVRSERIQLHAGITIVSKKNNKGAKTAIIPEIEDVSVENKPIAAVQSAIDRAENEIAQLEGIPQSEESLTAFVQQELPKKIAEKPATVAVRRDICTSLCAGNIHSSTKELAKHCERGCRFFDLSMNAEQKDGKHKDLNTTKDKCSRSCYEAYGSPFIQNCLVGCSEMHRFQKEALLFFVQQQGDNGILEVEVSLVSDPALWEQTLDPNNNAYKIPQTYMRTMPIRPELADVIDTKNWAPCAPPANEIPRWIVGLIAIGLTIFTLYVSFILPSRGDVLIEDGDYDRRPSNGLYEDDLRKELGYLYHGEYNSKKDGYNDATLNLVTLNDFLVEDYHFNVVPPPKYTLLPVDHKHSPV